MYEPSLLRNDIPTYIAHLWTRMQIRYRSPLFYVWHLNSLWPHVVCSILLTKTVYSCTHFALIAFTIHGSCRSRAIPRISLAEFTVSRLRSDHERSTSSEFPQAECSLQTYVWQCLQSSGLIFWNSLWPGLPP